MQNPIQLFFQWTKKKIRHHVNEKNKNIFYKEREIWWAALGHNIGFEINGKNQLFERPVLILKKYNEQMCFIVPLSTQQRSPLPRYQVPIDFDVKQSVAVISQGRTISTKRLLRKYTFVDSPTYDKVVKAFIDQFK